MSKSKTVGQKLIKSLRQLNRDLKNNRLSKYRITRVERLKDGTYKHTTFYKGKVK